jgi:hypothetical protein
MFIFDFTSLYSLYIYKQILSMIGEKKGCDREYTCESPEMVRQRLRSSGLCVPGLALPWGSEQHFLEQQHWPGPDRVLDQFWRACPEFSCGNASHIGEVANNA